MPPPPPTPGSRLSSAILSELRTLFGILDTDGDGYLSASDLVLLGIAVTGRTMRFDDAEAELDNAKRVAAAAYSGVSRARAAVVAHLLSLEEFVAFSGFFAELPERHVVATLQAYIATCERERGALAHKDVIAVRALMRNLAASSS